jgi:uncharacterized membrane protein
VRTFKSDISKEEFPISDRISGKSIRYPILNYIRKENPQFTTDNYLSISELNYFREKYISDYLIKEVGELTELEKTVLASVTDKTTLTDKIDGEEDTALTTGQRVADKIASFGGSWTFIILFGLFILIWITINVVWFLNRSFDPYPFIFLNLILSCLAAIQAPVIMMSQNRQEEKDRKRSKNDYMVNLKSELEIRLLYEKIDHLIMHQQQELLEIQRVQIGMMNDIINLVGKNKTS